MAFLRHAQEMLSQDEPARLDHAMLIAALAARPGAAGRPGLTTNGNGADGEEPLVELLTGGPRWRQALGAQRGCFNRAVAGRRLNGS